jgi:type III secretion system FlhB-like substrate exporter
MPNAPLAQALMKVPIGALIPPELSQAAAEVLAHVFRITGRTQEVLGQA